MKLRRLGPIGLLVAALLTSGTVNAQSKSPLEAADRLIVAQDTGAMLKDLAGRASQALPEEVRAEFVKQMADEGFRQRLVGQMRAAMAKHLTIEELDALADFYSKPVGKSALQKMGGYMAEVMPFIQTEMQVMVGRIAAAKAKQ